MPNFGALLLRGPGLIAATIGALGVALAISASASAAPIADPCGAITQAELARAFGLSQSQKNSTVIRAPGNSAGVIHDRCKALAWSGRKPSNARKFDAIREGSAADARLEAWVPDDGPFAANWYGNFASKIKGLTSRARATFVEGSLDGRAVSLPKFGAERSVGFIATTGNLRKVRAFWWSPSASDIVSINAVVGRGKPLLESIKAIAKEVVPAIG